MSSTWTASYFRGEKGVQKPPWSRLQLQKRVSMSRNRLTFPDDGRLDGPRRNAEDALGLVRAQHEYACHRSPCSPRVRKSNLLASFSATCPDSNFVVHHCAEFSLDTPRNASSTWVADASSFESGMKYSRPITQAVTDEHLRGVPKNGGYGQAYGRPVGLEHRGLPLSQCSGDKSMTNLKPMGLDSGIDDVHQVFGVRVMTNQPFMCQAPMSSSVQDECVPRIYVDGKDGWYQNSKVLAYLQPQQVHKLKLLQQRKFDEGSHEDVQKIIAEKLLEVCTDDQRSNLLQSITSKGELVNVSLNMHGTRAVQKLIETLKSHQHVAIVTASLRSGVVTLIKDLNGNHVIQCCLQHLSNEDNQFIFEAAAHNCVEIATHRHGCCVLQRCIDHSTGVARQNLIWEIASNYSTTCPKSL
ncbi:hypothetical protein GOP47_0006148 [Adiantum capillus-veneris]|uniref:PUM-HD domain-containing protein n=1 Tax=Adiantum capillus-veneris TaxID=13818 RepID=A0A9D4V3U9_ADICA|nr:hypothetical protein GOP47_0006148 [Adiantum capillus-veneris]